MFQSSLLCLIRSRWKLIGAILAWDYAGSSLTLHHADPICLWSPANPALRLSCLAQMGLNGSLRIHEKILAPADGSIPVFFLYFRNVTACLFVAKIITSEKCSLWSPAGSEPGMFSSVTETISNCWYDVKRDNNLLSKRSNSVWKQTLIFCWFIVIKKKKSRQQSTVCTA